MSAIEQKEIIDIAKKAGEAILDIYGERDFQIESKRDQSPLTIADKASHEIIAESLSIKYPHIPILSEEGNNISYEERSNWNTFWLVDPLDGTKEFIKRNGDFTVNIALVDKGYPVLGVIYVPVTNVTYAAEEGKGAYRWNEKGEPVRIRTKQPEEQKKWILVESRSHPSPELEAYMNELSEQHVTFTRIQRGSSLKFCAVAEGQAHMYPRLGPTMEWDTASGQIIVEEAGGTVKDLQGNRFLYNKRSLVNDHFIVNYQ
ncbi:3'(2'),5'-bisphosphate nucleotidase CysQ [Marinicrinis sediminis]|uniref:3'(2'),5'-bisphosphate nucleotidase CysQ n=1 Tax=Marinicrinis sediminis TaxID=1652465 RepID=A0ABW5RB69_9BACL